MRDPESQSRSVLQKAGLLRQTRIIKSQSPVPADSRFEAVSPVVVPFSLSYSHSLHRIISVSAGLGFVSMGSEFKADNMSTDINTRWEIDDRRIFHYLTIPVGVQLMLPIRNGGLYASFDPQLGFLLSAKRKVHNTEPGGMVTDEEINMRDVPGNDFPNLNFSLGFRVGGRKSCGKARTFLRIGV